MKRGKLIVFEGISGTGKETQAKLLNTLLTNRGIKSHIVYHPSPELKAILSQWRKTRNIDHVSEAYFLLADRYNRVQEVIKPALEKGEWVISLRNWISVLVYQAKTPSDRDYLTKEFAWFEPKADYLFYFDLDADLALERIKKRGEAFGFFESREKLRDKRNAYQQVLRTIPYIMIDASASIESIHLRITKQIVYRDKR